MAERLIWARDTPADVGSAPSRKESSGTTIDAAEGRARVAYFGPDLDDPAVRRRVAQWRHAGFGVWAFAFSRGAETTSVPNEFISLGRIMHLSRARRVVPLAIAALRTLVQRRMLRRADLFIGRNLDNALLALFARWIAGSSAPFIYEIFDVNQSCTGRDLRGALFRCVEKWVLRHIDLLVVSSPHFVTSYYEGILGYRGSWLLFENKVPENVRLMRLEQSHAENHVLERPSEAGVRRWRIGWFGYLDDERSWATLRRVAEKLPHDVAIHVRGTPYTNFNMDRFLADVDRLDNVTYGGPYRNPEDLAEVYNAVDMIWSVDCNVPTANSKWLLTNGLYEAGYFGKPVIGLLGTAVGQYLANHGSGWCLPEPADESLIDLIRNLSVEEFAAKKKVIAELRTDHFVETDEIERIWAILQNRETHHVSHTQAVDGLIQPVSIIRDPALSQRHKVLFIGLFPPPVDGQRLVTQRVFERVDAVAAVMRYDMDPFPRLGSMSKLISAIGACFVIVAARAKGYSTLYLAPHSGAGLLCSCLIALVGRWAGCALAIHYHSYWNIGRHSRLMAAFLAICGPNAVHIVLGPPMARDLQRFYSSARRVAVVSNSVFIAPRRLAREYGIRRLRIGHLSNLSREKGIALVLGCMRELQARGIDVELWLAGPAESGDTRALIADAQATFGERLKYLGGLNADDVRRFYEDIDVFLFPTLHKHEAEPLVVLDAVAAGVPVIATDRGCIGYLLGTMLGCVIPAPEFIGRAAEQISIWARDPGELASASHGARARFIEVHNESQICLDQLLATVLGEGTGAAAKSSGREPQTGPRA